MRIYFTTVNRGASVERGGELVCLDWNTRSVVRATPIYPTNPRLVDPNPRGNSRGGRGIAVHDGELIIASYHTLKIFAMDLEHRRDVTHPLFAGVHEIHRGGNGSLWVSSTAIDAALQVDWPTGQVRRAVWPRENPSLQDRWGLIPLPIDKRADNRDRFLDREHAAHRSHVHLNAVTTWKGAAYALFNSFGAIVNLDTGDVPVEDRTMRGAHNLRIEEDGTAYVNDTLNRAVRTYDIRTGQAKATIRLTDFAPIRSLERKYWWSDLITRTLKRMGLRSPVARPLFVRGMDRVGSRLYVGMSPASIACIDLERRELVDFYQHSRDVGACVHGIKVIEDQA